MNIVVTGASGRLGSALRTELLAAGHHVVGLTRTELDVTCSDAVDSAIERLRPDIIVNCTGYNAVDAAESNPAPAFAVNAEGPAFLGRAVARSGATIVHYSTDFVFDGAADRPYPEDAAPRPLNVYGASKLAGEDAVRDVPRHYILRVESLFGGKGIGGHVATVDYLANSLLAGGRVRAFTDRTVTPSFVPDVVAATRALLERKVAYGTYHCVNSRPTTWYALAEEMAARLGCIQAVEPTTMERAETRATRPWYCALSNSKLSAAGILMPDWRSAIARHLATRAADTHDPIFRTSGVV